MIKSKLSVEEVEQKKKVIQKNWNPTRSRKRIP
jgi:hypothetical protein